MSEPTEDPPAEPNDQPAEITQGLIHSKEAARRLQAGQSLVGLSVTDIVPEEGVFPFDYPPYLESLDRQRMIGIAQQFGAVAEQAGCVIISMVLKRVDSDAGITWVGDPEGNPAVAPAITFTP